MGKTDKLDDSIYYEKVPGSGGIISSIFFAVFGTIAAAVILAYATTFICHFAGIDFDGVLLLREYVTQIPDPVGQWLTDLLVWIQEMVDSFIA